MIDFPFSEPNLYTSLYSLLFWVFLCIIYYDKYISNPNFNDNINDSTKLPIIFFVGIYLITNTMNGDFLHFMDIVHNYSFTEGAYNYGESIYKPIIMAVGRNYLLFRTVIWGGALLLFCIIAKRFDVPIYYAVLLMLILHSRTFCYARATLAMAFASLGFSFFCKPNNNKIIKFSLGILFALISTRFHNSGWIMIAMLIFLAIPIEKKWGLLLSLLIIPLLAKYSSNIISNIFDYTSSSIEDYYLNQKIERYSNSMDGNQNIFNTPSALIGNGLLYLNFFYPIGVILWSIIYKKNIDFPFEFKLLFRIVVGYMITSCTFFIIGSHIISVRVMLMSFIPLTIIISKCYEYDIIPHKTYHQIIILGVLNNLFTYCYNLYCVISV